jgi:hypothetical protein
VLLDELVECMQRVPGVPVDALVEGVARGVRAARRPSRSFAGPPVRRGRQHAATMW